MLIPSAERPEPQMAATEFAESWSDLALLAQLAPVLSCGETETLADLLASEGCHESADALRAAHVIPDLCSYDHNTGQPLDL